MKQTLIGQDWHGAGLTTSGSVVVEGEWLHIKMEIGDRDRVEELQEATIELYSHIDGSDGWATVGSTDWRGGKSAGNPSVVYSTVNLVGRAVRVGVRTKFQMWYGVELVMGGEGREGGPGRNQD